MSLSSMLTRRPWIGWVLVIGLFGGAIGVGVLAGAWAVICRSGRCPSIAALEQYVPRQTSKVYAADGRFITELGLERRTLVRLQDIPKHVRDAVVMTEDRRFYQHAGIDYFRIFGAALRNIRAGGYAQGFSTITMQLARNVFSDRISREKTLLRKVKEARVARAIEMRYSKDKILELYLNQVYLGNGAYGVETASQRYFGKSVRDVTVAEAAVLAGLLKGPERYNPRRFADRAIQRRNTVLELMRRGGAINDADASLAKAYPLQLAERSESGDIAPYFVEWVRQELEAHFGKRLYDEGLKVYTSLDVDMQTASERALENQLQAIEAGRHGAYKHLTYEAYLARSADGGERGAANAPYLQGAFVAIDPRSGAVRAMVGGRDFGDSKFNRAVQALRQPGSTFKPVVYATAIHEGFGPSQVVDDSPISLDQVSGETWTPQNYDLKFQGNVPLRRALYMSRNVPAIRTGMAVGTDAVISMARRFGISTPIPPYPSIFIGSADVYPVQMIGAYSVFANLGLHTTPHAILKVENAEGKVIWKPTPNREAVLSPEEAWLMVSMMKDVVVRGTAARIWSNGFRVPAGGKTGTTNDGADVWFIGYTADLVAGVWMGFDRPQKIKSNAQGGELAAPAWAAFMTEVYRRKPQPPDWPRPDGVVTREVDAATGRLANSSCLGAVVTEFFVQGYEPTQSCSDASGPTPMSADSARIRSMRDTTNPFRIPPQ
ncbi:MAG TPA: PBP1A family penicillin-binding protein [Gemmatimonas aurantiaca]|uniref:peptidoglycan glycosyltransferase n=2 Tax=Gemmatimonas aurantiaca TaxID=173480 RepID=C1A626_GEMAT|nr:PBP1A family penicillin-binding protein [Gemmatimonas aurantiaca]BAH37686.1 penicillin-binding protein [Gemmatimonas aurantiaca T-27]HCT58722.1 PBP1A family penicillin-binding protein [Gemmatimonas aurantiaca]